MRPGEWVVKPDDGTVIRCRVRTDVTGGTDIPFGWSEGMDPFKGQIARVNVTHNSSSSSLAKTLRHGVLRVFPGFEADGLPNPAQWSWSLAMFELLHPEQPTGAFHWFFRASQFAHELPEIQREFAEDGFGVMPLKKGGIKIARFDGGRIGSEVLEHASEYLNSKAYYACKCPACTGQATLADYLDGKAK